MTDSPAPRSRLRIRVDADGLAAWLSIASGPALAPDAIREALAEAGIVAGLDDASIALAADALASEAALADDYCVARGEPAVDATPDSLDLGVAIGPIAGMLRPDQTFDFRDRKLIVPVEAGDRIGRLVPGQPGKPGFDVFGEERAPGLPTELRFDHGDGILLEADGSLIAARSGARTVDHKGVLDVVSLFVHKGSVDLRSGNLETEGSLQIAGDVTNGMIVHAGADLSIRGTVESAQVDAGGSIEIGGGVVGSATGRVRAQGDLTLRHALSARLFAGGVLEVKRGVVGSELHAREITIGGALLGDKLFAESKIRVRDVGSPAESTCLLRAAQPLELPKNAAADADARDRARSRLGGVQAPLSARKARETRKGRGERPATANQPAFAPQVLLRKRQRELQASARIEVAGTAQAGCRIDFGGRPLVLAQPVRARCFRFDVDRDEIIEEEI